MEATRRIVYRVDADAIVIGVVFGKKTRAIPTVSMARLRSMPEALAAIGGGG